MPSRETSYQDQGIPQGHDQMAAGQATARGIAAEHPLAAFSGAWAAPGHATDSCPCAVEAYSPGGRLSDAMACVARFHEAFGLPRASRPSADIQADLAKLRVDLLVEEVGEFADATAKRDIVAIADALADIAYVAYGAAVTYGIDLDAALREVHRSNMSKLDEHGEPVYREDGKVLKSSRYTPPDISGVLAQQPSLPF